LRGFSGSRGPDVARPQQLLHRVSKRIIGVISQHPTGHGADRATQERVRPAGCAESLLQRCLEFLAGFLPTSRFRHRSPPANRRPDSGIARASDSAQPGGLLQVERPIYTSARVHLRPSCAITEPAMRRYCLAKRDAPDARPSSARRRDRPIGTTATMTSADSPAHQQSRPSGRAAKANPELPIRCGGQASDVQRAIRLGGVARRRLKRCSRDSTANPGADACRLTDR